MNCARTVFALFVCALVSLTVCPIWATSPKVFYCLGPGDVLQIIVADHPELTFAGQDAIQIRPDGKFSYPYASEIMAEGKTVAQVTAALVEALKHHLRSPDVAVNVTKYRRQEIYLLGEVEKPGLMRYPKIILWVFVRP